MTKCRHNRPTHLLSITHTSGSFNRLKTSFSFAHYTNFRGDYPNFQDGKFLLFYDSPKKMTIMLNKCERNRPQNCDYPNFLLLFDSRKETTETVNSTITAALVVEYLGSAKEEGSVICLLCDDDEDGEEDGKRKRGCLPTCQRIDGINHKANFRQR